MHIEIEIIEDKIGQSTFNIFRPKNDRIKASIIHFHGWSSSIESYNLFGQIFAMKGYQLILPEIPRHGKRGTSNYETFEEAPLTVLDSLEEYKRYEPILIDKYLADTKVYVSGHSLGALITACIVNTSDNTCGQIIYNGIYDFEELYQNLDKEIIDKFISMDPKIKDQAERISNIIKIDKLEDIDSLILVGLNDDVIDPRLMKSLENKISDKKRAKFVYYGDIGHAIAYKMIKEVLNYLDTLLES